MYCPKLHLDNLNIKTTSTLRSKVANPFDTGSSGWTSHLTVSITFSQSSLLRDSASTVSCSSSKSPNQPVPDPVWTGIRNPGSPSWRGRRLSSPNDAGRTTNRSCKTRPRGNRYSFFTAVFKHTCIFTMDHLWSCSTKSPNKCSCLVSQQPCYIDVSYNESIYRKLRKQIAGTLQSKFWLSPFQHCMHKDKCTHTFTNAQSFECLFVQI